MSLLQGGAVNIAGKRIPFSVLAVVAAVGAALLIVSRLRSTQSAVSLGTPVDLSGANQPLLDQLTASTQALQSAVGSLTGAAASAGAGAGQGTGTAVNIPPQGLLEQAPPGFPLSGYGAVPIYLDPGGALWSQGDPTAGGNLPAWAPFDMPVQLDPTRNIVVAHGQAFEPVLWGGLAGWIPQASFTGFDPGSGSLPTGPVSGGTRAWAPFHPGPIGFQSQGTGSAINVTGR